MNRVRTRTAEGLGVRTNIHVAVIDAAALAVEHIAVKNVTCVAGHESTAALFGDEPVDRPAQLALGLGGASGTDPTNRALNNEDETVAINSLSASGTTATIRTYVPSLLQIGTSTNTVDEVGVVLDSGDLLNHATISAVDLSGTDTSLVVTVDLTAKDPSQ